MVELRQMVKDKQDPYRRIRRIVTRAIKVSVEDVKDEEIQNQIISRLLELRGIIPNTPNTDPDTKKVDLFRK